MSKRRAGSITLAPTAVANHRRPSLARAARAAIRRCTGVAHAVEAVEVNGSMGGAPSSAARSSCARATRNAPCCCTSKVAQSRRRGSGISSCAGPRAGSISTKRSSRPRTNRRWCQPQGAVGLHEHAEDVARGKPVSLVESLEVGCRPSARARSTSRPHPAVARLGQRHHVIARNPSAVV